MSFSAEPLQDRMRPTTWNVSNVLGYNYTYNNTYFNETTARVSYAQSIYDSTLDRSYEYDAVGRLVISHSGAEARSHAIWQPWGTMDGPYSQGYEYDVWGNVTHKYGWGGEVQGGGAGESSDIWYGYTGNKRDSFVYDAAGNVTNDGTQTFTYDATGQQTYASGAGGGWGAPPPLDDNPLKDPNNPESFKIKAIHITQLRTAINALREHLGLADYVWVKPRASGGAINNTVLISWEPIDEMRTALNEALGPPSPPYADGLTLNQPILAAHIQELRDRVTTTWNAHNSSGLYQSYDGDGLRVKKTEYGATTYYLRSTVLGGQVVAELDGGGNWQRGYVYAGSSLMAVQQSGVFWMHEDPVTKSKRVADVTGQVVSIVELDPWGADTSRSASAAFQPRKFTSYDRDGNGSDEAMFRRYNRMHSRFDQPDPYDGSFDLSDPQSFNRYAYTKNDPVNRRDPMGLNDYGLGPPPPAPTLVPYGGTIVTNTSAPYWSSGGGSIFGGGGGDLFALVEEKRLEVSVDVGGTGPQNLSAKEQNKLERQLSDDVRKAFFALQKEKCKKLFKDGIDPGQLLMATYLGLYGGGTIGFGDLKGVNNGTVVAAATTINTVGSMALQGPSGVYRRSITSGADITINTNFASPFRTGFRDFLSVGASDATYRAMLLIHELGHVARRIYGVSGSQIEEDTDVPNAPTINKSNTKRVYDNCFK